MGSYHYYNTIWDPVTGEVLPCKLELNNPEDHFAIAVCKHCKPHAKKDIIMMLSFTVRL